MGRELIVMENLTVNHPKEAIGKNLEHHLVVLFPVVAT